MLATAQVRLEFARPVVYRAAFAVARAARDARSRDVSHAKVGGRRSRDARGADRAPGARRHRLHLGGRPAHLDEARLGARDASGARAAGIAARVAAAVLDGDAGIDVGRHVPERPFGGDPVKTRVSAARVWFDADPERPRLIGSRCRTCRSYFFPKETFACRNPECGAAALEDVPLSATGTLWSFTDNHYQPPAPYVSPDPFVALLDRGRRARRGEDGRARSGRERRRDGRPASRHAHEAGRGDALPDDAKEYVVWKWAPAGR